MALYDRAVLPRDMASYPVQALAPDETTLVVGTIDTAVEATLPLGEIYELNLGCNAHIRAGAAGGSAATTSSRFVPAGSYVYSKLATHVSLYIIKATGATAAPYSITQLR